MKSKNLFDLALNLADSWISKNNTPDKQEAVLKKLLQKSMHTAFGRHYQFNRILAAQDCVNAFRGSVPIHSYEKLYDEWWHRTIAGEANVCWPGKVKYFALSSGTSSATSKRIPITQDMFSALRRNAFGLFATLPSFNIPESTYTKSWLGIGGSSALEKVNDHYEGYLSGINAKKRPFWTKSFYKPENEIASIPDFQTRTEWIAAKAPDWDIGVLIGIPHWVQITLERIIEKHKLNSIKEIWPSLHIFVSGGTDYIPYQKAINRLIGHPIAYLNTYMASEGFIGHQTDSADFDLQLLLNNGIFFEFVPFDTEILDREDGAIAQSKTFTINEVSPDIDYAVIITTCSGAWRYELGDVIRFSDTQKGRFKISGRTKYYLNLCSEHLTGDNTNEAVRRTEEELGISIPEYMVTPKVEGSYIGHHWYIETPDQIEVENLTSTLDYHLRSLNDDYHTERNTRLHLRINLLPHHTFYEWQKARGQDNGQSKVPRVAKGKILDSWLEFIKEQGIKEAKP